MDRMTIPHEGYGPCGSAVSADRRYDRTDREGPGGQKKREEDREPGPVQLSPQSPEERQCDHSSQTPSDTLMEHPGKVRAVPGQAVGQPVDRQVIVGREPGRDQTSEHD